MIVSLILTVFLAQGATGSADQTPSGPNSGVSEHLVVTAQFRPESARESLVEVEVLHCDDRADDRNLRELLDLELGMASQQHSVFGSSLSIDGVSHENVEILVNGMPVLGRLDGIIDLEQIGLEAFSSVEILRGPGSVYYGTDTQGGVVNLIPRAPSRRERSIDLSTGFRDPRDSQQTLQTDFALGQNYFTLSLTHRQFAGADETPTTRRLDWAERGQERGSLHWRRIYDTLSVSWFASFADEALSDLGEFDEGFALDSTYHTRRNSQQLYIDGVWGERVNFHLFAGYGDYDRYAEKTYIADSGIATESTRDAASANSFEMLLGRGMISMADLLPGVDGQIGLEWRQEEGAGGRILDGTQEIEDRALFAGLRWHWRSWSVQPMARLIDNSIYDAPTTPSFHAMYQGKGDLVWRSSYSRGFRGPSIKQLFLDFRLAVGPFQYHISGNDTLEAERGSYYKSTLSKTLWSGRRASLAFKARGFYNRVDNLIALSAQVADPQTPNLIRRNYINVNEHRARGGDLAVVSSIDDSTHLEFGAARIETYNQLSEAHPIRSFDGRWDGRMTARYRYKQHRFSLEFKHVGDQPGFLEVSAGRGKPPVLEEVTVPAYGRVNLFWNYTGSKRGLSLSAGVKNLADVRNRDTLILSSGLAHESGNVDWGRRFHVTLGWRWSKPY